MIDLSVIAKNNALFFHAPDSLEHRRRGQSDTAAQLSKRDPRVLLKFLQDLPAETQATEKKKGKLAGTTGLEPATSDVTGRRSNQLNYVPALPGRRISE